MRVQGPNLTKLLRTYLKQQKVKKSPETNLSPEDQFEISEESKLLSAALQELKKMPEIRQERVEQIKAQIKARTYNVSAEKVAEKMLQHFTVDKEL